MTFSFATPLQAFGIDINANSGFDGAFQATTSQGVALSVYDAFPLSEFFSGQFLGFSSTNPFSSVTIALGPSGDPLFDAYTLDTMRDGPGVSSPRAPVPAAPGQRPGGTGLYAQPEEGLSLPEEVRWDGPRRLSAGAFPSGKSASGHPDWLALQPGGAGRGSAGEAIARQLTSHPHPQRNLRQPPVVTL